MSRHTRIIRSRGRTRYHEGIPALLADNPKAYSARLQVRKGRVKGVPLRTIKLHKGYTVFTREDGPLKPKR